MGGSSTDMTEVSEGRPLGQNYLLHEAIGSGAMGLVYRATRRDSDLDLVAKVLRPEYASDPEVLSRFLREREIIASIRHANVVRIHDLVAEGDRLSIVMARVKGGDLTGLMSHGPVEPALALDLAADIADGLVAVHAAGVVHRDLKPSNVLCQRDGDARPCALITDFGVSGIWSSHQTTSRAVMGTYGYIAPEVLTGARATPASDLYALGVIVYELFAGRRMFTAEHPMAVAQKHLYEQPVAPPGMSAAVWAIVSRLVAKEPEQRPSAAAAASVLRSLALDPAAPVAGQVELADAETQFRIGAGGPLDASPTGAARPPADAQGAATMIRLSGETGVRAGARAGGGTGVGPQAATQLTPILRGAPGGPPSVDPVRAPSLRPAGLRPPSAFDIPMQDEPARRSGLTRRMMAAIGGSAAAVLAIVAVSATLLMHRGTENDTITQAGATTSPTGAPGGATVPVPVASTAPPATAGAPPVPVAVPGYPAGGRNAGYNGGGQAVTNPVPKSVGPPSPGAPPAPLLSVATGGSGDQRATLSLTRVAAGSGRISSVTVTYAGGSRPMTVAGAGAYSVVVTGLTNGQPYGFAATVCNSNKLCTWSNTVSVTPHGTPDPGGVSIGASGLTVTVSWTAVSQNGSGITLDCTISVSSSPADASAPGSLSAGAGASTHSFTGNPATTYTATKRCTGGGLALQRTASVTTATPVTVKPTTPPTTTGPSVPVPGPSTPKTDPTTPKTGPSASAKPS